jgi:hypothetical protein
MERGESAGINRQAFLAGPYQLPGVMIGRDQQIPLAHVVRDLIDPHSAQPTQAVERPGPGRDHPSHDSINPASATRSNAATTLSAAWQTTHTQVSSHAAANRDPGTGSDHHPICSGHTTRHSLELVRSGRAVGRHGKHEP